MDSDQLSIFNDVPGVNITASSLLPNGHVEILGVRIFDRERMGILVSFHMLKPLVFSDYDLVIPDIKPLIITSVVSLIAASGLLLAIAVGNSTPSMACH